MAWFRTDPQEVLKETVLWTNPSPTSSFAGGTIADLSDDINNYDYLKFEYRHSTSVDILYNIDVPVDLFKTSTQVDYDNPNHYLPFMTACASGQWTFTNFLRRGIARKTDTSVYFTGGGNMGSTTANNANIIPIQIIGIKRGIEINQPYTIKEAYRNIVLNSGLTLYQLTPWSSRASLNEGGIVVDTASKTAYLYVDFTMLQNLTTASTWFYIFTASDTLLNYMPKYQTDTRNNDVGLSTDSSSSNNKPFLFGYGTGSQKIALSGEWGQTFNNGDHYIVYGSWTY